MKNKFAFVCGKIDVVGRHAMTISLIPSESRPGTSSNAPEAEAAMEELLSGSVKTPEIVRLLEALNRTTG